MSFFQEVAANLKFGLGEFYPEIKNEFRLQSKTELHRTLKFLFDMKISSGSGIIEHAKSIFELPALEDFENYVFAPSDDALFATIINLNGNPYQLKIGIRSGYQYSNLHVGGASFPDIFQGKQLAIRFFEIWSELFGQALGSTLLEHGFLSFYDDIDNLFPAMQDSWNYLLTEIESNS